MHLLAGLATVAQQLPVLLLFGWVVRVPGISREEGHEAITRAAWEGLRLAPEQQRALIQGVRAPDVGLVGLVVSALPFAQRRHALRAWSGTSTDDAVRDVHAFLAATHERALAMPEEGRWTTFGEALHCLQDSFSPAHVDRLGGQIVTMRHWGPLDRLRGHRDEHGFPSDRRDSALDSGTLTAEAGAAVEASRRYLEIAMRHSSSPGSQDLWGRELEAFLDECVCGIRTCAAGSYL